MASKSTKWVTVPDEKVHTPASKGKKGKATRAQDPVQNKLLWGIGFVVVIAVTITALSPQDINSLLQGNIFETAGTPASTVNQEIKPLEIIGDDEEEAPAEPAAEVETETTEAEEVEEVQEAEPVSSQPETEAVSIAVEPITEAETIVLDDLEPIASDEDENLTANEKLLKELAAQVEDLKAKDEASQDMIEDLVTTISEEGTLRGSAPGTVPLAPEAPAVTPPAITTTNIISQPGAVTGFRANTHTVAQTPQQVLAQNQGIIAASGGTTVVSTPVLVAVADISAPSTDLSGVNATPETGPEALMLAMLLAFVSLLGWKAKKTFA